MAAFVAATAFLAYMTQGRGPAPVASSPRAVEPTGISALAAGQSRPSHLRQAPGPSDADAVAPSSVSLTIVGLAVQQSGQAPSGAVVTVMAPSGQVLGRAVADTEGSFRLALALGEVPRRICVVGASVQPPLVSLPWFITLEPVPTAPLSVLLLMRPAGIVEGRAVDRDGNGLGGVLLTLAQLPDLESKAPATWEVEYYSDDPIVVATTQSGRFSAQVRLGEVLLRARAADGTRSEVLRTRVTSGAATDVGDIRLGVGVDAIELHVTDWQDRPLPGAWIQLDDRTLRFGHLDAVSALPNLIADAHGHASIGGLTVSDFPLAMGVGDPSSGPERVIVVRPTKEPIRVRLQSRAGFDLRLDGGCSGSLGRMFERATWTLLPVDAASSEGPEELRTAVQMIAGVLQRDTVLPDPRDPCLAHAVVRQEGSYRLSGRLRGGSFVDLIAQASADRHEMHLIALPSGRWVRLRAPVPADVSGDWHVRWRASNGEVEGDGFTLTSDELRAGAPCWAPEVARSVGAEYADSSLLELAADPAVVPPQSDSMVDLTLVVRGATTVLHLQLTAGTRACQLADWPIWIAPLDDAGRPQGSGLMVLTGRDGVAVVRVRSGHYQALALKRLGFTRWVPIDGAVDGTVHAVPLW